MNQRSGDQLTSNDLTLKITVRNTELFHQVVLSVLIRRGIRSALDAYQ